MNVLHYEPWVLMNRLQRDLAHALKHPAAPTVDHGVDSSWIPAVDIEEEDTQFVLQADLPGLQVKDIEITLEKGVLTLRGQRGSSVQGEKTGFRHTERATGAFHRRFNLPDTANASGISARFSNGVLQVTIPKQAELTPQRITIEAA